MGVNTYSEMNSRIKDLLRLSEESTQLYAAQRIEELEEELEKLKRNRQWIEFKIRDLTEEEQEEHPELDDMLDCKLPDDCEDIWVYINRSGQGEVMIDTFYSDNAGCCLESGCEIGEEATHWMPIIAPFAPEEV